MSGKHPCFFQVPASGNFQLEVQVVRVRDPVDYCGTLFDMCDLYTDEMCLDPKFEEPGSEEEDQDCSLIKDEDDLNLEFGLPKTKTLSVTNQPWPVSCQQLLNCIILSF